MALLLSGAILDERSTSNFEVCFGEAHDIVRSRSECPLSAHAVNFIVVSLQPKPPQIHDTSPQDRDASPETNYAF